MKTWLLLVLILSIAFLPRVLNKITLPFPAGQGGLYFQFARSLAENHFRLPLVIPYYGFGRQPFVYPPLSFINLGLLQSYNWLVAAKYLPEIYFFLSSLLVFVLSARLNRSILSAFISLISFSLSRGILCYHVGAEGVTRGLALLFGLLSLTVTNPVLSGIFLGAAFLTHPSYFVFGIISIFYLNIFHRRHYLIKTLCLAFLFILPWLIWILLNYGLSPMLNALNTHGSITLIGYFTSPGKFLLLARQVLYPGFESPYFVIISLISLFILILKKRWFYPLWILSLMFATSFEGQRFVAVGLSLVIGAAAIIVFRQFPQLKIGFILSLFLLFIPWTSTATSINLSTIDQLKISLDLFEPSSYLLVSANTELHEWLPFLVQQTPVIEPFGTEWTGQYDDQITKLHTLQSCRDSDCLPPFLTVVPEAVIIHNSQQIELPNYILVYQNPDYLLYLANK